MTWTRDVAMECPLRPSRQFAVQLNYEYLAHATQLGQRSRPGLPSFSAGLSVGAPTGASASVLGVSTFDTHNRSTGSFDLGAGHVGAHMVHP